MHVRHNFLSKINNKILKKVHTAALKECAYEKQRYYFVGPNVTVFHSPAVQYRTLQLQTSRLDGPRTITVLLITMLSILLSMTHFN